MWLPNAARTSTWYVRSAASSILSKHICITTCNGLDILPICSHYNNLGLFLSVFVRCAPFSCHLLSLGVCFQKDQDAYLHIIA